MLLIFYILIYDIYKCFMGRAIEDECVHTETHVCLKKRKGSSILSSFWDVCNYFFLPNLRDLYWGFIFHSTIQMCFINISLKKKSIFTLHLALQIMYPMFISYNTSYENGFIHQHELTRSSGKHIFSSNRHYITIFNMVVPLYNSPCSIWEF